MKASNFTATLLLVSAIALASTTSSARPVDPTGAVGNSALSGSVSKKQADPSQWEQLKKSVSRWYDDAKTNLFGKQNQKSEVATQPKKLDPVEQLTEKLPDYTTPEKGIDFKEIQQVEKTISAGPTSVASPGRKADANLPTNRLGIPEVPTTDSQQVKSKSGKTKTVQVAKKKIPLLNVGLEQTLQVNEFLLPHFQLAQVPKKNAEPLATPELMDSKQLQKILTQFPIVQVEPIKDPRKNAKLNSDLVTQKMIDAIQLVMKPDKAVDLKPYVEYKESDIKMLAAIILNENGGNCEAVMGLFYDLLDEPDKQKESQFRIGACAQKLKLYSTSYKYLGQLVKEENATYSERALKLLAEDLPRDFEGQFAKLILGLQNKAVITQKVQDVVYYRVAKGAYDNKNYKSAKNYAEKVSEGSVFGLDALYVSAISDYALGRSDAAEKQLENLLQKAAKNKSKNKDIYSLAAMNLARIHFTQEKFKTAHKYFAVVDKNSALWVRALVEQGWAQLMMGDAAGAIGNMYSLHSPYFKAVYKPESYVVRTIGYLNICQYGDAYKTLSLLEEDYRPWQDSVSRYIETNKASSGYYSTVKKYLTGQSSNNVDGLPFQVIREMARQKGYLNAQSSINEKIDENTRYRDVFGGIAKAKSSYKWRRGKAKERLAQAKSLIAKSKTDSSLVPRLNQLNAQVRNETSIIVGYNYLIDLMDESRKSYKKMGRSDTTLLKKYKANLEKQAGQVLAKHLKEMKVDMARMLSNNEFLRYEVFAGSGQNIRYQVAGGSTAKTQRIPASIKPEKSLNWSFSGEYWEDEIGSYRSSLKNNCPQVGHFNSLKKDSNNNI